MASGLPCLYTYIYIYIYIYILTGVPSRVLARGCYHWPLAIFPNVGHCSHSSHEAGCLINEIPQIINFIIS